MQAGGKNPKGSGRKTNAETIHFDGPLRLVAFVAVADGKWSFLDSLEDWPDFGERVKAILGAHHVSLNTQPCVVGLGVVRSWRFVHTSFSHRDARTLAMLGRSQKPRQKECRFLEHEVLDTMPLTRTLGKAVEDFLDDPCEKSELNLWRFLRSLQGHVLCPSGPIRPFGDVINEWVEQFGTDLCTRGLLKWPACNRVSQALVHGTLKYDVSIVWQRQDKFGPFILAPDMPSAGCLRQFRMSRSVLATPLLSGQEVEPCNKVQRTIGSRTEYTAESLIKAMKLSNYLKSAADLKQAVINGYKCAVHFAGLDESSELQTLKILPSKQTIARSRLRLDIATMLAHRSMRALEGPSYRYLGFDASPQSGGVEVFATLERSVLRSDVRDAIMKGPLVAPNLDCPAKVRRLPLTNLGQGRASLSDKVRAVAHQMWLEHGGPLQEYLETNLEVRGIISDMGTESAISDAVDVSRHLFGNPKKQSDLTSYNGFLYPLALYIPGPQHTVDNVTKEAIKSLAWFPRWAQRAKRLCQWVSPIAHREVLQNRLNMTRPRPTNIEDLLKALGNTCQKFASWRWKTIDITTSALLRIREALLQSIGTARSASDLGIHEKTLALNIIGTVNDDEFWQMTSALHANLKPLAEFSSWLYGCPCHEKERRAGKQFTCNKTGCRGPELLSRVETLMGDIRALRGESASDGVVRGSQMITLTTTILAGLSLRFAWLKDLQFMVWQVSPTFSNRVLVRGCHSRRETPPECKKACVCHPRNQDCLEQLDAPRCVMKKQR